MLIYLSVQWHTHICVHVWLHYAWLVDAFNTWQFLLPDVLYQTTSMFIHMFVLGLQSGALAQVSCAVPNLCMAAEIN